MAVDETCPVCRTAEVVCGKWTLLLVRDLAEGRSRFCQLERSLAGISPRTLSLRLRALEEEGIVERDTFGEVPPRVEYALTEKGLALLPIIDDMRAYGEQWLGEECVERQAAQAEELTAGVAAAVASRRRAHRPPLAVGVAPGLRESAGEGCNEGCAEQERSARGRTQPTMRVSGLSSGLESALGEYAQAAAHLLHADIVAGAEVELELGSRRGRAQTAFYSCRPLTERFIAEREAQLQRLPEHDPAVSALAGFDGLDRYLAGRAGVGGREGEGGGRSARGDDVL